MKQIGQAVDDRHGRLVRQLDRGLMREGANHDQINRARNVARDILDRFALADTDIVRRQINRMATELRHAGLEGDARPQRRLLKYHRERLAAQVRMLESNLELGLEPRAERQQPVEFGRDSELRSRKSRFRSGGSFRNRRVLERALDYRESRDPPPRASGSAAAAAAARCPRCRSPADAS